MRTPAHRPRRRRAKASGSRRPRPEGKAGRRDHSSAAGHAGLVVVLLDHAFLIMLSSRARVGPSTATPSASPGHPGLWTRGVAARLLALAATPEQLARVFDLDLWRAPQPGMDEQFDADRFGVWLEVLMESGATSAAQTLAGMDVGVAIAGLSQHARVFDHAAVSPSAPTEGADAPAVRTVNDGLRCEIGGYLVVATRSDSWDAIVALLHLLDAEHHDYFHRVMRGCRRLSNSRPEADGLDDLLTDREQVMFDLAFERERRREKQGYVTPAHARAFLQMSRQLRLGHDSTPPGNPVAPSVFSGRLNTTQ